jgi:hypothetical protein
VSRRARRRALAALNLLELAPFHWLVYLMAAHRIRLDDIGSEVWRLLDGTRTVQHIATILRSRFGDRVEPAEERVGHLVRVLHREDLVAYPGWDPVARQDADHAR